MTYSYSSGLVRKSLTTGTSKKLDSLSRLCRRCASLAGMLLRSKSIVSSLPNAPPLLIKLIIVICTYLYGLEWLPDALRTHSWQIARPQVRSRRMYSSLLARWGEVGKCSRDGKAVRVFDAYNPTIDDCSIEISKIVLRIGCF